jgi:hypothetical protein
MQYYTVKYVLKVDKFNVAAWLCPAIVTPLETLLYILLNYIQSRFLTGSPLRDDATSFWCSKFYPNLS